MGGGPGRETGLNRETKKKEGEKGGGRREEREPDRRKYCGLKGKKKRNGRGAGRS